MDTPARENYPLPNTEMKTETEREIYLFFQDNNFWYSNVYCNN